MGLTTSESEVNKLFQLLTLLVLAPSRNCVLLSPALATVSTSPMARNSVWEDKLRPNSLPGLLHNPNSGRDQLQANLRNCHLQVQSRKSTGRKNMVHRSKEKPRSRKTPYSVYLMNRPNSVKTSRIRARKMTVTKSKSLEIKTSKTTPASYNSVTLLQGSRRVMRKFCSNRSNRRK